MNLSVVIPTHNRHQDISRLLDSLIKQDVGQLQIEILVIANTHDSILESIISNHSDRSPFSVNYFFSGHNGVNWARNMGIEKAKSSKIYFLDDDVFLTQPKHLQNVFQLSLDHPQAAAIGGSYLLPSEAKLIDEVYFAICTAWLKEGNINENETYHLVGGNTLYNRDLLQERLRFNESIKFGGSETELNLKLQIAGDSFLFSNTIDVEHSTHLSTYDLMKKAIRQGMGRSFHEMIVPEDFWKVDVVSPKIFLGQQSVATQYLALYDFFFHVGYRHGKRQKNGPLSIWAIIVCMFYTFFQINADQVLSIPNPEAKPFHQKKIPALKFREIYHWIKANVWWKIPYYIIKSPYYYFKKILFYLIIKLFYVSKNLIVILAIHLYNFFRYRLVHIIWFIFHIITHSIWMFSNFLKWRIKHYFMKFFNYTVWKIVPLAGSVVVFSITNFFPFNTIGLRVPYNNAFNKIENFLKRRN